MTAKPNILPSHSVISEPLLAFHPQRSSDVHAHPLRGLLTYGPYSRSSLSSFSDPIRVACIYPYKKSEFARKLFTELDQSFSPKERKQYLFDYPGFTKVFGLRIVQIPEIAIELPSSLDAELKSHKTPHARLSEVLTQSINMLEAKRNEFDILMIFLPTAWQNGFYGAKDEDFDLHDYLKALTATKGLPLQVLREDQALSYFCRCSVMWRLAIALYCKVGGVPWKLAEAEPETAFIGLSYAMKLQVGAAPRFITCCSQVFDSDGAGLQFLAYETNDFHIERENPYLSRGETRKLLSKSLALYQRRHAGKRPRKLVIHKSTQYKTEEIDGLFDEWRGHEDLHLIQVQQDVVWRGIAVGKPLMGSTGVPERYPCRRGVYLPLSGKETLLWTQGNAPEATEGKDFFKEGKGIPSPLLLKRFAGHGAWELECKEVLGLSKMNWNNDSLYDRLPVTLGYASVLAQTIKRLPTLQSKPYEFRFFM